MKILPAIALIAAATAILASCKTNENNYREAYETVVRHQSERNGDLDTPELQATGALTPKDTETGGVILPMATTWIASAPTERIVAKLDSVKHYNVVVARFRQGFNAGQMLSRLRRDGYPGALVIKTAEAFFVATSTTASPDSALAALNTVRADSSLRLKAPFPFILRPGHLAR